MVPTAPQHGVLGRERTHASSTTKNGEVVRRLAEIMEKPWDNDKAVLAIACNDIGNLVREVPEKRCQARGAEASRRALWSSWPRQMRTSGGRAFEALGGWLKYSFDTK